MKLHTLTCIVIFCKMIIVSLWYDGCIWEQEHFDECPANDCKAVAIPWKHLPVERRTWNRIRARDLFISSQHYDCFVSISLRSKNWKVQKHSFGSFFQLALFLCAWSQTGDRHQYEMMPMAINSLKFSMHVTFMWQDTSLQNITETQTRGELAGADYLHEKCYSVRQVIDLWRGNQTTGMTMRFPWQPTKHKASMHSLWLVIEESMEGGEGGRNELKWKKRDGNSDNSVDWSAAHCV